MNEMSKQLYDQIMNIVFSETGTRTQKLNLKQVYMTTQALQTQNRQERTEQK